MVHQPRFDPYSAGERNEYYSHHPDDVEQPAANPYATQHTGYAGNNVYGERPAYDPDAHAPYEHSPYRSSEEKRAGASELPVASDTSSDFSDMDPNSGVKRALKTRHLSMMALAGIIGPGLLIGAGGALAKGGPASLIIGFGIIGMVAFSIMQSLGELTTLYPTGGAFTGLADRFVDKAFGVALGWNYFIIWFCVLANEYNVLTSIFSVWTTKVPQWGFFLIFWVSWSAGEQARGRAAHGEGTTRGQASRRERRDKRQTRCVREMTPRTLRVAVNMAELQHASEPAAVSRAET